MKYMEDNKEKEVPWCNNLTWREMQISMSEDWAKNAFGYAIFGHLACRFLDQPTSTVMTAITDSGFRTEACPVVRKVGAKNCMLIRITRAGHNFDRDSRGYIDLSDLGVHTVELSNHYQEIEYYHTKLRMVVEQWLAPPRR